MINYIEDIILYKKQIFDIKLHKKVMPHVRLELTTFRLWDWRAADCANAASTIDIANLAILKGINNKVFRLKSN